MHPISRLRSAAPVTVVAVTAVVGIGLTACSPGGEDTDGGGAAQAPTSEVMTSEMMTSEMMTTTRSAPVPGPADTSVDIPAPVADRWAELGGEEGEIGRATGPAREVAGGSITDFERGSIVLTPAGRALVVQGEILAAYREAGGPAGELGFPTADEATTDGGWISTFEGGTITFLDGRPVVEVG
ncbi:hypothetical protein [Rhodococcus sp. IEGM 1408]|uniref:LGFP repeat-containing protein n=1 Tax=Rhodococcus sp. IEGM 1408 TaxID=3082220 RepID=UPI002952AF64|nr:hypothetical protein [Rhodococcus sp. IEGM 1408]MDV8000630.1 hypothetical protein [Rhodococcus sp. IEGM 1408]